MEKTKYVVGYLFNEQNQVLLIKKKRPVFLVDKMNGIGGHVEDFDESGAHAMQRETLEESSIRLNIEQIIQIGSFENECFVLDTFAIMINDKQFHQFCNNIDEEQSWFSAKDLVEKRLELDFAEGTFEAISYIYNNLDFFKNIK